ncbi:MAG: hypothetical protein LBS00_09510 [Synergistaceae bacterium]|jgi:hypothetical protein|nr:hypothetical protein [Synergistaceae bacterium]
MKQLSDTVWQRQGISWIWDENARNLVCDAGEIWSLRQLLMSVGKWNSFLPVLPSNGDNALVVAGLDGSLDLLSPADAENWLGDEVKEAVLSFQSHFDNQAALIFWLPDCASRVRISATDEVSWVCGAPHSTKTLDFGRVLWGEAREYPKEIFIDDSKKPAGLYHRRIS